MDIETMNINNAQQPVLISLTHPTKDNNSKTVTFLLDHTLSLDEGVGLIWFDFFNYIQKLETIDTIFVHNLGGFDGIYIYKYLLKQFNISSVNSIIDDSNKFITISLKLVNNKSIKWVDSYRIFPVSLDNLCTVFGVEGKLSKYNSDYQNLYLFNNKSKLTDFINYCKQDTISLYNALIKSQTKFISDFNIDITKVLSTSNLALKIFRSNYLDTHIPILKRYDDNFIRSSYFGGSTDYYKAYGTNLKYYDVNSLYPYAMLNHMPLEITKVYKDMTNISLDSVFGFFLCEVKAPEYIKHPILPYKTKEGSIYPIGSWKGVYFSEELKNARKYGYQVNLLEGLEFSKHLLFNSYVDHFYEIKKMSSGPTKFISKLMLNTLYGVFGRKQELLKTINIHSKDLLDYTNTHIVKNVLEIDDDIFTLLVYQNLDQDTISELNVTLDTDITDKVYSVKSNVALAAAVTSYARVHMSQFKNNPNFDLFYTDTDSIFVNKELPLEMIGDDLGLMKDELDGGVIEQAYFLGIKQYGYWFYDKNGHRIEKSVFAGVTRNSLSFQDVISIFNGHTIVKTIKDRFFRSLSKLEISVKDVNVSVSFKSNKSLVNNNYQPVKSTTNNVSLISKLINLYQKFIKR